LSKELQRSKETIEK